MERWAEANWTYLRDEMARVGAAIERAAGGRDADVAPPSAIPVELVERAPAIARLARAFNQSPFERDLVLACAAVELELEPARRGVRPTLSLALAAFPGGGPQALEPSSPLRRYRIVEPGPGPLMAAPLALGERIVQFLLGSEALDDRLAVWLREVAPRLAAAERLVAICRRADAPLLVGLSGSSADERQAAAAAACQTLGRRLFLARATDLPGDPSARHQLRLLWERELRLAPLALLVELDRDVPPELVRHVTALLHDVEGLAFVSSREPIAIARSSYVGFELPPAPREQRLDRMRQRLGARAAELDGMLDRIATQFVLTGDAIERACLAVDAGDGPLADRLWSACREQARPRLDDIARRIEPMAGWDDLVLPPDTLGALRAISSHIRHRAQVYEQWGFGARANRGLGTGALFAGPSGTGKTLAAEVLAREANLDLYHIDLSQIVNKYVGETEKNLRRVFDAAEDSGAILLFDEADALFGKRGDVEKGTDRYANLEVSYLLQRMEAYRGLAILTTNQRDAIDNAFLRRLRFVVTFPFPDVAQRVGIWQRAFPADAPCHGLDAQKLARLKLPGGNIRNVAINAAFLAAAQGQPITMRHVLAASRAEFVKIDRPFPEVDVQGWLST